MRFFAIIVLGTAVVTAGCASPLYMGQQPSTLHRPTSSHMSEEHRAAIRTVLVRPSDRQPVVHVDGDYLKETPSVGEGAATGAGAGFAATGELITEDARGILIAPIVLPFAVVLGSITGAAAAKIQQEIQEHRDELTAEITEGSNRPLPAEVLAVALSSRLEGFSGVRASIAAGDGTNMDNIDAFLDVGVTSLTILVTKGNATMTTNVSVALRNTKDNSLVFGGGYSFSQKDSLRNWAADDYENWAQYLESAKRNISREISADMFERILLRHVLRPVATETLPSISRGNWNANARSQTPTLAWELFLLGGDSYGEWVERIDKNDVLFDLEIFDGATLAYAASGISEDYHEVQRPLENCKNYSWSVRPVYHVDGKSRAGEWMRSNSRSFMTYSRRSFDPETQQFWEGFPRLKTRC